MENLIKTQYQVSSCVLLDAVDFYNLTKSPTSELQMVKDYLEKASDYKRGHINPMEVGIIEDNFTSISEGVR